MSRKPGAPWEYMLDQYRNRMIELGMVARDKGDAPEVDSAEIWSTLLGRLLKKEYSYDVKFYGDLDELAERVAYFFHANLQGVAAAPRALETLTTIGKSALKQGLLSDAQWFTLAQLRTALKAQGEIGDVWTVFDSECMTLSCEEGVRKPSPSLYETALARFARLGIAAPHVLHVGCRLNDDLAAAKRAGMRTVLYAGDKLSLQASKEDLRDPEIRPDRLITELPQLLTILGLN
jgi:FMN phosphatase YigB (HAD superfamily)